MKKYLLKLIFGLLLFGCATVNYTPEEQSYINRILKHSNPLHLPKSMEKQAWERATVFINKYSSMKLQIINENILQTYNSTLAADFAYDVTKLTIGDSIEVALKCYCGNDWFGGNTETCKRNEKILADFMITGELPFPHFINEKP